MSVGMKVPACVAAVVSSMGCKSAPRSLEGTIQSAMRRNRIVGLSAVVVSGDRRVLSAGYGFADKSLRSPVTPDTVFPLASTTKLFTATAVMQLVEQGLVDLDAPVSRYVPELVQPGRAAAGPTVRQLLTYHGGVIGNLMEGFEIKEPDPSGFRAVPRRLAGMAPVSAADTVFAYSNSSFSLLGCMVENVNGTTYAEFVSKGILEPLGMLRSGFLLSAADARRAAMGYEGSTPTAVYPLRDIPAGGLLSSATDMERFMGFVFDGGRKKILGKPAFAEMVSRQNAHVALDGDSSIGLCWWLLKPFAVEDAETSTRSGQGCCSRGVDRTASAASRARRPRYGHLPTVQFTPPAGGQN